MRFGLVGAIGFLVDAGGTWSFVHLGFAPTIARIPALALSIGTTWLLNRSLTFRVPRSPRRSEWLRYGAVALSSALLNFLLYTALVLSGVPVLLAVATATGVLMFYSFCAYRTLVFA